MDWLTPAATAFLGLLVGVLVAETWHRIEKAPAVQSVSQWTTSNLNPNESKFSIIEPPADETVGERIFNSTPIQDHVDSERGDLPEPEVSPVASPPSEQA